LKVLGMLGKGLAPKDVEQDGTVRGDDMVLELEFVRVCSDSLRQLSKMDLDVLPQTYARVLMQMLADATVPFNGEPLRGLQVMGPLETRLLDFKKVVILSCDEGVFPRRSVSSSFIPPELRRGFGLPTYEHQDAVWAYYFYRLLQRADEVWLLHDSRTEGMSSGEESRYIRQLEYGFGLKLDRMESVAGAKVVSDNHEISKTPEVMQKLHECQYSATTLQHYLECPAMLYYEKVEGLRKEDELTEDMDASMIGNVLHNVMRELYTTPDKTVSKSMIADMRKDKARIRKLVEDKITEELKTIDVSGRNLIYEEVIIKYIDNMLERELEYLGSHSGYRILGLEKELTMDFKTESGTFHIKGKLDRLDTFADDDSLVRVVDYKTGKVSDKDIMIGKDNAGDVAEAIFSKAGKPGWPKIALQLYIYDLLVHSCGEFDGKRLVNAIYSTKHLFSSKIADYECEECGEFTTDMDGRLSKLFADLMDPALPMTEMWEPGSFGHCKNCDFKDICRR